MEHDRVCRVLVTNDDGIESEGLQVLARHLEGAGHDVMVVAPDGDFSGSGASLGLLGPGTALGVRRVAIDGLASERTWALAGPPALTVVATLLGGFGELPDLVVSGINAGLNTGRSVLHSGTVGAALTAQNFGLSALAVSVGSSAADSAPWQWDTAASIAVETLSLVVDAPARSVLNLNVPGVGRSDVRGMRWARLAPFGAVRASVLGADDASLQFELVATDEQPDARTDQGTVDEGWASLTTLVGVAEAWPEGTDPTRSPVLGASDLDIELVPGAALHAVHRVPDGHDHRSLHRPRFA